MATFKNHPILYFYSKCQKYSPTEPSKTYDKAVSRRSGVNFDPRQVMEEARCEWMGEKQTLKTKDNCLRQYTEVHTIASEWPCVLLCVPLLCLVCTVYIIIISTERLQLVSNIVVMSL